MIFFCVPTDFSENSIELLKNLNESHKNKKVCEVYGNLNPSKFGSGRHDKFLPKISLNQLESYINGLKKVDIEFNYTLNNLCFNNLETLQEGKKKIFEFIEILWNIGVEKITVANPYVLNFINSHFPDIKITASSIAHINSLMKVKEFMKIWLLDILACPID
ncbi:MAG: U32 family peptidase, partial [Promethearchaeota archaeon]